MRSALYFPHTVVKSARIIRSSLILWDKLEYIVPDHSFTPDYRSPLHAEAMEIIGKKRVPTNDERREVHTAVEDMLRLGVPDSLSLNFHGKSDANMYEMWSDKLLNNTWDMLRDHQLVRGPRAGRHYAANRSIGLTLMSILADVLAGSTRSRVTDRGYAYATMANAPKVAYDGEAPMAVLPLTFRTIAVDTLPLEKLIAFRRREEADSTGDYRQLRKKYRDAIDSYIEKVSFIPPNSSDRTELDRAFEEDMDDDLRALKSELGFAKRDAWLSKDTIALVVAGFGLIGAAAGLADFPLSEELTTPAGAALLLGGLMGTGHRLARSRREILKRHPMSYLYELGG